MTFYRDNAVFARKEPIAAEREGAANDSEADGVRAVFLSMPQ
jgi:hypothetical protein